MSSWTAEIIKNRLFFTCTPVNPTRYNHWHCFTIDKELVYENFYGDFGPLNLAMIFRYCCKLNKKLKSKQLSKMSIYHYCSTEPTKLVNAAFLVGAYSIVYLQRSSDEIYSLLLEASKSSNNFGASKVSPARMSQNGAQSGFAAFRDASLAPSSFPLTLLDTLRGFQRAFSCGLFSFDSFDLGQYEFYELVENGDLNWVVPYKCLAFAGPHSTSGFQNGYPIHSPEAYFNYFRKHGVSAIVRLNKKLYDSSRFTDAGFEHHELFFPDGSIPTDDIVEKFLLLCDTTKGAVAVHCKAGLGRTGTLIAAYLIAKLQFTAPEAIAWLRICRPGSVIGPQQHYLLQKQKWLRTYYNSDKYQAAKLAELWNKNDTKDTNHSNDINGRLGARPSSRCDNDSNTRLLDEPQPNEVKTTPTRSVIRSSPRLNSGLRFESSVFRPPSCSRTNLSFRPPNPADTPPSSIMRPYTSNGRHLSAPSHTPDSETPPLRTRLSTRLVGNEPRETQGDSLNWIKANRPRIKGDEETTRQLYSRARSFRTQSSETSGAGLSAVVTPVRSKGGASARLSVGKERASLSASHTRAVAASVNRVQLGESLIVTSRGRVTRNMSTRQ